MFAYLIEGNRHQPLLRFANGQTGVPVNLRVYSRSAFLALVGRRFEIRSRLSSRHYTVRLSEPA